MNNRFLLLGAGNMGREIAKLIVRSGVGSITVDPDPARRLGIPTEFKTRVSPKDIQSHTCVVLCMKPQDLHVVTKEFAGLKRQPQKIISVLAGVTTSTLKYCFPESQISRVMPNMGLKHACSDTVYYSQNDKLANETRELFVLGGDPIRVYNDTDIDVATAIVGSGPAFFLEMSRIMSEEAKSQGISSVVADAFAKNAMTVAAQSAYESSFNEKIEKIASKGGTTEAGLNTLARYNFSNAVSSAIRQAITRGSEIDFEVSKNSIKRSIDTQSRIL